LGNKSGNKLTVLFLLFMATLTLKYDYRTKDKVRFYLRFKHNTREKLFALDISIPLTHWDRKKKDFKRRSEIDNLNVIEGFIVEIIKESNDAIILRRKEGEGHFDLVVQDIFEILESKRFQSEKKDVLIQLDVFITDKKKEVKELTIKKYNTLKKHLLSYAKESLKTTLNYSHFDKRFEINFRHYLNEVKGLQNDTATKYVECLKIFLKWSYEKGYLKKEDYKGYSLKRSKTTKDVIALTQEEVIKLRDLDLIKGSKEDEVRDFFLFMCLTGQRVSDAKNLKWSELKEVGFKKIWELYQRKGNKENKLLIPIFAYALTVLDKREYRKDLQEEVFLTSMSEGFINRTLKTLSSDARLDRFVSRVRYSGKKRVVLEGELNEYVSCHTGRRTFTSLLSNSGVADDHIRSVTGHEDNRTLLNYKSVYMDERNNSIENILKNIG